VNYVKNIKKSMEWFFNNSTEQYVHISNKQKIPYPEVTGYYIPTLRRMGFHKESKKFADYLANTQNLDGGWGLGNRSFIFDTDQVIDGLSELEGYKDTISKALEFIDKNISGNKFNDQYGGKISDHIYPRVLFCIKKAGYDTSDLEKKYCVKSNRLFNCLSHFYGYSFEGHARLNYDCSDFLGTIRKYGGCVPEMPGMNSICFTGLSQVSLSLFLCSEFDLGINILNKVSCYQNQSGGFYGSNGKYFSSEEISWAVKFYLDACFESSVLWFKNHKHIFKENFEEGENDPRLRFVKSSIKKDDIVLDIGCGKGRYINNIDCKKKYASDISCLYDKIDAEFFTGSCLNIPVKDKMFSKVICAETLEHTVFHKNAIEEMIRVIKDGGELLIIDKDGSEHTPKKIHFIESWPNFSKLLYGYNYKIEKLKLNNSDMPFVGVKIYV
jgi:malonyl-CoA O-methyltransferase